MVVVVVSRLLVGDRLTLMSAAAWLAPHSARNVQFTYISPYPPDPDSATQESALFSQFPANPPAKGKLRVQPTFVSFPLLVLGTLWLF